VIRSVVSIFIGMHPRFLLSAGRVRLAQRY